MQARTGPSHVFLGFRARAGRFSSQFTAETERSRCRASGSHARVRLSGVPAPDAIRFIIRTTARLVALDMCECPAFGVDMSGCGEAAGRQGFHPPARYGFHLTGVTASGVPLLELTQPDAVRLHGLGSL